MRLWINLRTLKKNIIPFSDKIKNDKLGVKTENRVKREERKKSLYVYKREYNSYRMFKCLYFARFHFWY